MAQQAVERVGVEKHDYARTGRMALYGGGMLHRFALNYVLYLCKHNQLIFDNKLNQPSLAPQLHYGTNSSKQRSNSKTPISKSLRAFSPINACLRPQICLCS